MRQSTRWLGLAGILAVAAVALLGLLAFRDHLERRAREELQTLAREWAARADLWHTERGLILLRLAEQRGLREGAQRLVSGAPAEFRSGFLGATDAALRSQTGSGSGFESLALRDTLGNRLAGTGLDRDSLALPANLERIGRLSLGDGRERWTVPVRDPQARPLALLVADLNLAASRRPVLGGDLPPGTLAAVEDAAGARLWEGSDSLRLPPADSGAVTVQLESRIWLLEHATASQPGWVVLAARDRRAVLEGFPALVRRTALVAGGGILLLAGLTWALTRDRRRS